MAKRYMPWEEIALWSLLGGVLAIGLSWTGLSVYRWVWDEQALSSLTGKQRELYSLAVVGTGALITAVVLAFGAYRATRPAGPKKDAVRRR
jgi:hypothetical protein